MGEQGDGDEEEARVAFVAGLKKLRHQPGEPGKMAERLLKQKVSPCLDAVSFYCKTASLHRPPQAYLYFGTPWTALEA